MSLLDREISMVRQARGSEGNGSKAASSRKKGKRGAPQTFASKLFSILQGGTPIVGWSTEGDSFTVHNDKEFESKVLKANYRHANFSSFQRQLNMYGFRKVADCSDRTYSHPFFRRNQPNLLSEVRRVVSMTAAAAAATAAAANMNASEIAASMSGNKRPSSATRSGEDEDDYGSHTTGESDGGGDNNSITHGNGGDGAACPPARKKLRVCVGGVPPSSSSSSPAAAAAAAAAARAPVVHLQHLNSGAAAVDVKRHPVYAGGMGSSSGGGIIGGGSFSHQLNFGCTAPLPGAAEAHRLRVQAAAAGGNNASVYANAHASAGGSAGKQEFPSPWHQHTGLWGGVSTNACIQDPWGSGSGSPSSAASSVEASSPVLLPINPADLDCSGNIPPFYLHSEPPPPPPPPLQHQQYHHQQQTAVHSSPVLVSPVGSSAVAEGSSVGGAGADWRGGGGVASGGGAPPPPPEGSYPGFARSVSPAEEEKEVAAAVYSRGLYSDAWNFGDDAAIGGGAAGFAAGGRVGGAGAGKGEDGPLSLDKAFGFGAALARCPSFDLIIDSDDLAVVDVPVSPTTSLSAVDAAEASPAESFAVRGSKNIINSNSSSSINNANSNNNAVPVSPASPVSLDTVAAAAASAAASAASTAASSCGPFGPREAPTIINRSVGWDLASLGGPGWGSPDTHHSAATEPWAALPPLGAGAGLGRVSSTAHSLAASSIGCVSSTSISSDVWKGSWGAFTVAKHSSTVSCSEPPVALGRGSGSSSGAAAAAAAAVVDGGGYGVPSVVIAGGGQQEQQQQPARLHSRTLSTLSTFSLPAAAADSLDWALLAEDTTDSSSVPSLMGFDDATAFSGMVVGPVGGGGLSCRA